MRGYIKTAFLKMTPPTRLQNNAPNTRFSREKSVKKNEKEGEEKRAKGEEKKVKNEKWRAMVDGYVDMLADEWMNGWTEMDGERKNCSW